MNRTRIVFITIVSLTVLFIGSMGILSLLRPEEDESSITRTDDVVTSDDGSSVVVDRPSGAVTVLVASSNTKESWLDAVVLKFNSEHYQTTAGNSIFVEVAHVTSGGSMNAILDDTLRPVAWSPGDQSWVDQANITWQQRHNKPLASASCVPTIYAPLGFAMWRPMAETLGWPESPIGWDTLTDLAADPDGWATYGRPEWGQFTFGHTHPGYANSGLLSMTAFVYGIAGKQSLTPADVYSDKVTQAMISLEQNTAKYGRQAPALLELMAQQGASYLHAAAVPEAEVIRFNVERADELAFPLAFVFPSGGTIWADHPYCVLDNTDWVDAEEAEAGRLFQSYLLADAQQEMAIDNYLRPLNSSVVLHAPLDLAYGTDPTVTPAKVPAFPSPDAVISEAIIDQFLLNKRKATVIVVLDVSGSMEGEKMKSATQATVEFLSRLHPDDEVAVMTFSDVITVLSEPNRVGDVSEALSGRVSTLVARGNTALYDAVCQATTLAKRMQAEDLANNESRLYGVVVLSDGDDTVGRPSQTQMFATCLPTNAEANGIKIFPIAFGDAANEDVLSRVAIVTGGRMFTADPASIQRTYESISAEQ